MAFDGDRPVATGALFRKGRCAWLSFGTTDEEARGRGAQSALLAARLDAAARLGCELATIETAEPKSGVFAPSYRNAIRLGFKALYSRPNYIWERSAAAG